MIGWFLGVGASIKRWWPLILAGAVIVAVGAIYFLGRRAGLSEAQLAGLKRTVETQRRITDADAAGPRTANDAARRMRDGSF